MAKRFDGIEDFDDIGTLLGEYPFQYLKDLAKETGFDMNSWQEQVLKEALTNGGKKMSLQTTLFGQQTKSDPFAADRVVAKSVTPEEVERLRAKVVNQRRELKRLNRVVQEKSALAESRLQLRKLVQNNVEVLENELDELRSDLEHEQALTVYYHAKYQKAKKAAKKASRKA